MTRAQAIRAKCYDCMGGYVDGKRDCEIPRCPLYGFMPYRKTRLNPPEPPKTTPVINFVDLESGEGGLDLPTSQITEKKQLKMEGI